MENGSLKTNNVTQDCIVTMPQSNVPENHQLVTVTQAPLHITSKQNGTCGKNGIIWYPI
jgi:hypothetical protein